MDVLNKSVLMNKWTPLLKVLPFYTEGVGWIVPAFVGACLGMIASIAMNKKK